MEVDITEQPVALLKSAGPKLVPFLKTLGMYFVIFVPVDRPSWFGVLIKCLPIASLVLFVLLHGITLGQQHNYARKILFGLILSGIGDALLVWPTYFLHGMIVFGLAHVSYIWAFGLEPLSGTLGVIIYGFTSIGLGLIMPGVMATDDKGLIIGVPVYFVLLTTMLWRACARIQAFEDIFTWSKLCACFGSIAFLVSDSALGINQFFADIPNSQALIMSTYYAAQFGLALSIINSNKATNRVELDSEVIDIDHHESTLCSSSDVHPGTSNKTKGWRRNRDSFDSDDDDDLTLPKTRFSSK